MKVDLVKLVKRALAIFPRREWVQSSIIAMEDPEAPGDPRRRIIVCAFVRGEIGKVCTFKMDSGVFGPILDSLVFPVGGEQPTLKKITEEGKIEDYSKEEQ